MGRSPCCSKEGLNRGAWTAAEDKILKDFIKVHGEGRWRNLPKKAGLKRCGKSCRLRWLNYLRPDIKRGNISHDEEELIIRLHKLLGNRWSLIAGRLPGRTDNEIKNYWNTNLGKKVHDQHTTASSARKKNQFDHEKNKNKCSMASPAMSNLEPQPKNESHSHVIRTKAVRCTRVFIPHPHKIEPTHCTHDNPTVAKGHPTAKPKDTSMAKPLESAGTGSPYNGLLSFTGEEDNPTDFMLDVNLEDVCLADLLNSDFTALTHFNYSNNIDLSSSSDEPLIFSNDMLEDWTVTKYLQPNVASNHHGCTYLLESEGDWLAE